MPDNLLNGFISYSHDDATEVAELKQELETFVTCRQLTIWYDRMIDAGTKWNPEIETNLNSADIVIFCITSSFLKSASCREEFRKALELKRDTYAEIIPVILKECEWKEEKEISIYQARPDYGKAIGSFINKQEAYEQIKNDLARKIILITRRKNLRFTESYEEQLQSIDPLLMISGSDHLNLKLNDIYVDPELTDQWETNNEVKPIQGIDLLDLLIDGKNVLISGDSQSGKTSICKNMCMQLFAKSHIPVYFSGKESYQGGAEKAIERMIRIQYSDPDCIDNSRVVLVLDDFHKCPHFEKFLANIPQYCSVLIAFSDIYSLNLRNTVTFREYHPFAILPLRARKRNQLITKWLASNSGENTGYEPFDNYKSHDSLVTRVESTLGKVLGRGIIPAYPFYILSILITSQTVAKPLNQEISSQGYCYQVLLYAVLWRVGVRNQQIDMYVNVLTELAYMLFKKCGSQKCSEDTLKEFEKDYTEKYNLQVPFMQVLDKLEKAKVFGVDAFGYFDFCYSYLKYYFIAKYLAEHYDECDEDFERVFSNLGSVSNGYIAIFVAHHERSVHYLNRIGTKTAEVFKNVSGCYLSNADISELDKQSQLIIKAALPQQNNNPDEEREKLLAEEERIERLHAEAESSDEEIQNPEIKDLVIAIRLCQVLGQILKIRPASIPLNVQKELIRTIIDAHARMIRKFFDTFKDGDAQESIIDYISHAIGSRQQENHDTIAAKRIRKLAEKIFWNLNFIMTYGITMHCVNSIGSTELVKVIKSVCYDNNEAPLMILIPYVVEIIYQKKVNINGMRKVFPKLSETVRNMLRFVVVYFCRIHRVPFKERQQVEQLFNLKPLLPLYVEAQKS